MKRALLFVVAAAGTAGVGSLLLSAQADGCPAYIPVSGKTLIAHAGGGLPDATYTNSIEAMDLAVHHRFRLIEIDMWLDGKEIILSHDRPRGGELRIEALLEWMRLNSKVLIVTDFKTNNVRGLTRLAEVAGPLTPRFVPQIYNPSEYGSVTRLGMQKPIFTLYRVDEPWREFANSADLLAVTFPEDKRHWAKGVRQPIFLHTINKPKPYRVAGFYTDCLIPAR